MVKKYKLFEGGTLQEAMNKLLEEGFFPVTDLFELSKWREKNSQDWVDSGIVWDGEKHRAITLAECKDLKKIYSKGGRLLFLGDLYDYELSGYNNLYNNGRFLGVQETKEG